MAEDERRHFQRLMREVPRGYVPVFYKSGEMISFISEEKLRELCLPAIYEFVRTSVNQQRSVLERKLAVQRSLIGSILCTIILATSVMLSSLSFISFNIPEMGTAFLYGAVVALGGMIFILHKGRKESV